MPDHNKNNCSFAASCDDPCNTTGLRLWNKKLEAYPGATKPDYDFCDLLPKGCALKPGSMRCYQYRCRRCKLWHDWKEPLPDDDVVTKPDVIENRFSLRQDR